MKKVLAALDNSLAGKSLLAAASTFATLSSQFSTAM